jgi:release factor glutamine methyltransferase
MIEAAGESHSTIREALRAATLRLAALPDARREAETVLAHALSCTRAQLFARDDERIADATHAAYRALIERRAAGEPFAYLSGRREFWSLSLAVGPDVLIPRPETELLVERALALRENAPAEIADLGTGSGAIAIACAIERPAWRITATDVSAAALAVARQNARSANRMNIRFVPGSWYRALAGQRFDLILSNPPYIAVGDPALAEHGLRFEPQLALVSGIDGLDALRQIIGGAPAHLRPGGMLIVEHGAAQGTQVAKLLVEAGLTHVRCHPDLAGLPRVTEAMRNPAHGTV